MATDVTLGVARVLTPPARKGNLDQLRVFLGACPGPGFQALQPERETNVCAAGAVWPGAVRGRPILQQYPALVRTGLVRQLALRHGLPAKENRAATRAWASLEINRRFNTGWRYLSNVQPYALVDYARTWYNNASLQQLNQRHLSSVALGLSLPTTSTIYSISTSPSPSPPAPQRRQPRPALQRELLSLLRRILNGMPPSRTNRGVDKSRYPRACCDRRYRFPTSRYVTPDVT